MVVLELDQVHVPIEMDTGAAVSLIAEELRTNQLFHGYTSQLGLVTIY